MRGLVAGLCLAGALYACAPEDKGPAQPSDTLIDAEPAPDSVALPDAVIATRNELIAISEAGSIRRLARHADREAGFLSNLGGSDHFSHWDLMRRTGFDPNTQLLALFEEPHGTRIVGGEVWFIWPDLAARSPGELARARASYRDAARLRDLLGPAGADEVLGGAPYPGVRTAISETGAWRYYLHEPLPNQETFP